MKLSELPKPFPEFWKGLNHQAQREILTCLGDNLKPLPAILVVKPDVNEVGLVLLYSAKHSIPYKVKRNKGKVIFTFKDKGVRNQVFIGMRTL